MTTSLHEERRAPHHTEKRSDHGQLAMMPALEVPRNVPTMHQWSPYADNGGTNIAVAGKGFVIVAGDTRLNGNFNFLSRDDTSKLYKLTDKCILASGGMQADRLQLQQVLKHKIKWYQFNNGGRTPSTEAMSQLLSTVLYGRRFFPLYTFNIIAGLNKEGDGVCYSYDAVGCTEPLEYGTTGSGSAFIEPLLDCLIRCPNQLREAPPTMTMASTLELIKSAFTSAAERDCYTGDGAQIMILEKGQEPRTEFIPLRKD
jgi:20S proteasome subunit beta 6